MGMIGNTLAQGLISGANIQDGTVDTADLKDSAVTAGKIATGTITPNKLSTGAPTWDSAGNVGLGVTPSTIDLGKFLEVGQLGCGVWTAAARNVVFTSNLYYNGGNKYATTGAAGSYQIANGVHYWYSASSGAANSAVTLAQLMTLDANGKLLLGGTTSDLSASTQAMIMGSGGLAVQYTGTTGTFLQIVPGAANGTVDLKADARSGSYPAMTFYTGGSERARIDSSGNLGIGTTSPANKLHISLGNAAGSYVSYGGTQRDANGLNKIAIFRHGYWGGSQEVASIGVVTTSSTSGSGYGFGDIVFYTGSSGNGDSGSTSAERARITSDGNLLVKATSTEARGVTLYGSGNNGFYIRTVGTCGYLITQDGTGGSGTLLTLYSNNTSVGSITTNGTSTTYGTSSDYRLKENIAPMTGALAKVAALKPVTYTWKETGEADEGFIAHELQEVCPSAVSGEKDAVDADGKPQYQNIDTSFLVATLTAAIQEQQAIITSLTERITALEAA